MSKKSSLIKRIKSALPNKMKIIDHPLIKEINDWPWKKKGSQKYLKCDLQIGNVYVKIIDTQMDIASLSKMLWLCNNLKNYYIFQATEPDWIIDFDKQIGELCEGDKFDEFSLTSKFRLKDFIEKKKQQYKSINGCDF